MDYAFVFFSYFVREEKDFGCNFVLVSDTDLLSHFPCCCYFRTVKENGL